MPPRLVQFGNLDFLQNGALPSFAVSAMLLP